jgi:hypothetical protein
MLLSILNGIQTLAGMNRMPPVAADYSRPKPLAEDPAYVSCSSKLAGLRAELARVEAKVADLADGEKAARLRAEAVARIWQTGSLPAAREQGPGPAETLAGLADLRRDLASAVSTGEAELEGHRRRLGREFVASIAGWRAQMAPRYSRPFRRRNAWAASRRNSSNRRA